MPGNDTVKYKSYAEYNAHAREDAYQESEAAPTNDAK
jgi:hypothetical protein